MDTKGIKEDTEKPTHLATWKILWNDWKFFATYATSNTDKEPEYSTKSPNSKPRLSDIYHIVIIYTLFKSRCPSVHENSKYSQKKTKRNSEKE